MRVSQPHWSSPSVWSPAHPPGLLAGPRLPPGLSGQTGGGRSGWGGRQGWGQGRTDHARGLLVSWGQRLQESSGQEKETKNNPERESPERGTGKWGAEGGLGQGNSDASLTARARAARLRTRRPRRYQPPPAPRCALSVSHRSRVNDTRSRAHTHTQHTRSHTRAHVHTHRARQLDASGHRASPTSLTFPVLMYSPPHPPPAPAGSLTGRPQAGSLSPLA